MYLPLFYMSAGSQVWEAPAEEINRRLNYSAYKGATKRVFQWAANQGFLPRAACCGLDSLALVHLLKGEPGGFGLQKDL